MANLRNWQPGALVQVLVYGKFKTSKTWGALTFPRPVVMDFDRGIATGRNPEFVRQYGLRDIEYEQFTETKMSKGVVVTHNAFDDACRYFDKMMAPDKRDTFDTWVIDSGTTLSEFALNKAIVLMGNKSLGTTSKTHQEALNTGVIYPKMQDYGSERSMVKQFIDMVKGSGKHVVFICHEKEVTDDDGTVTAIGPLLTGKGMTEIPLKFDEVYNVRVRKSGLEIIRYLQTQPDGIRMCGSRYGIPDGTAWNWDALSAALQKAHTPQ